jgi:hypothetical protein
MADQYDVVVVGNFRANSIHFQDHFRTAERIRIQNRGARARIRTWDRGVMSCALAAPRRSAVLRNLFVL